MQNDGLWVSRQNYLPNFVLSAWIKGEYKAMATDSIASTSDPIVTPDV